MTVISRRESLLFIGLVLAVFTGLSTWRYYYMKREAMWARENFVEPGVNPEDTLFKKTIPEITEIMDTEFKNMNKRLFTVSRSISETVPALSKQVSDLNASTKETRSSLEYVNDILQKVI